MSYSFTGASSLQVRSIPLASQLHETDSRLAECASRFLTDHVGPVGQNRSWGVAEEDRQGPLLFPARKLNHNFHTFSLVPDLIPLNAERSPCLLVVKLLLAGHSN